MSTSTRPKTKVRMFPLAESTTLTTPIRAPTAESSVSATRASGFCRLNMQAMVTQAVMPISSTALNILLNVFSFIMVE